MKYAVISDVHGNIEALTAVLRDIKKKKVTDILFLGDAVGYGPDPDECVRLLQAEARILLAGNHDWAVLGLTDPEHFNPYAREAIEWTRENMEEGSMRTLKKYLLSHSIENGKIFLVHATPKEPEQWHYLLTLHDAEINFHVFDEQVCLLGHSHQPFIIERLPSGEMLTHSGEVKIGKTLRYIVNAGSVGQPRDGDPRACYVIIDDETIKTCRIPYDVEKTQSRMRAQNLPFMLIERLTRGV